MKLALTRAPTIACFFSYRIRSTIIDRTIMEFESGLSTVDDPVHRAHIQARAYLPCLASLWAADLIEEDD